MLVWKYLPETLGREKLIENVAQQGKKFKAVIQKKMAVLPKAPVRGFSIKDFVYTNAQEMRYWFWNNVADPLHFFRKSDALRALAILRVLREAPQYIWTIDSVFRRSKKFQDSEGNGTVKWEGSDDSMIWRVSKNRLPKGRDLT